MLTYERASKDEHWGPTWKQIENGRSATNENAKKPPLSTSGNAKKPMTGLPENGKRRTRNTLESGKRSSASA
jgi:hypothetical protein